MKRIFAACALALLASGCSCWCGNENKSEPETIIAVKTTEKITLDGKLDEAAWKNAPEHLTHFIDTSGGLPELERKRILADKFEAAGIKVLYDDKYLYVGAVMHDEDVVSLNKKGQNQTFLYREADTLEIFMWPVQGQHYWELYVTPTNNKTSFFFPSGGMTFMPSLMADAPIMPGYEVAATIQGTLNDHSDRDKGWTTEVRIPLKEINAKGIKFAPGQEWKILFSRYNYSHFFYTRQNSAYPKLPFCNFHLRNYYAPVVFK